MANLTTDFEATLLATWPNPGNADRGLQAGAAYRLRRAYLDGMVDPAAHARGKANPRHVAALQKNNLLTQYDAITGP